MLHWVIHLRKMMPPVGDGPKPNKEDEGTSERPAAKNTPVSIVLETET